MLFLCGFWDKANGDQKEQLVTASLTTGLGPSKSFPSSLLYHYFFMHVQLEVGLGGGGWGGGWGVGVGGRGAA